MLLAELSTRFVQLRADEVDANIEEAQRLFCESLDLDRSGLWQFSGREANVALLTHIWERGDDRRVSRPAGGAPTQPGGWLLKGDDAPPVRLQVDSKSFFPWVFRELRNRRTIVIPCVEDLPAEAAEDREILRKIGTKSTVVVSLTLGGELLGCLSFATMRHAEKLSRRPGPALLPGGGPFRPRPGSPAVRDGAARERGAPEPGGGFGRRRALEPGSGARAVLDHRENPVNIPFSSRRAKSR